MSALFCKKSAFFVWKSSFTQSNSVRAVSALFSVFVRKKVINTKNITITDSVSRTRPLDCSKLTKNPENNNDVTISEMTLSSKMFDANFFLLSSLVTGPRFMSISSLVLELWQFFFIRDWPEIRILEIPPSEFCPISGDCGELWISNLARMFLIECYWMLKSSRVTAFIAFELLREKQLEGGQKYPPRVNTRF